mgnify:FL=1
MGRSRPLIPCTEETRELVKAQKRGGESYDSLLRKMVSQYDPEQASSQPLKGESA